MSETGAQEVSRATARMRRDAMPEIELDLTLDEASLRFTMQRQAARELFGDLARIFSSIHQDEADYWRRYFRPDGE